MDCNARIEDRRARLQLARAAAHITVAWLLGAAAASHCRADSQWLSDAPAGRALGASAHIDFKVTVLPSLSLSMQGTGLRIQGNGGGLTVQASPRGAAEGSAPSSHAQLRPRHQVIDTSMSQSGFNGAAMVTVASP